MGPCDIIEQDGAASSTSAAHSVVTRMSKTKEQTTSIPNIGADGIPILPGARSEDTHATERLLALLVLSGLIAILSWYGCRGQGHQVVDVDDVSSHVVPYRVQFSTATWQDLAQIPGIGEVLARRIVDARNRGCQLETLDDLRAVHGIGPQKLIELGNYIEFSPTSRAASDRQHSESSE